MVSIGEAVPCYDLLNRIADFFEEGGCDQGLTGMLEPIMLIVVGLLVGVCFSPLYADFSVITQGMCVPWRSI